MTTVLPLLLCKLPSLFSPPNPRTESIRMWRNGIRLGQQQSGTFWKPFPKSLTLLVHHSIFPGKDEHGIFAIAILLLTEGLFCHHQICKKNRGVKILPRHKPNVWKHLTHGEAAQLHPLVLRRGSQGILGNLCWPTWKSSATEKHRFKDHGKVCFNTRLLNTRAKNSKSPQRNMTIQF